MGKQQEYPESDKVSYYDARLDKTLYRPYISQNKTFLISDFSLVNDNVSSSVTKKLTELLSESKWQYLDGDLATCDITGVFMLSDSLIFCSCGTRELILKTKGQITEVTMSDDGAAELFKIVDQLRLKE
jgi:hypothetical protein